MAIATVMSGAPRLGIEYVAWSIVLTVLYLILQRLMASSFFRDRIMALATISAFVVGGMFVTMATATWFAWWVEIGHLATPPLRPSLESLTFGNPSAVMTASVLLTASAVAYLGGGSRRRAAIAVAAVALACAVVLLSGSRSGWLAVAIATGTTAILWLLVPRHRSAITTMVRSRAVRIATIPAVVVAIILLVAAAPGVIQRVAAGGEAYRTAFFAAAIRMFESSPLVGVGPGNWAPLRIPFTPATDVDYYIPHAHDIYLQTLAEYGVLGLAAGIIVVVLLGRLLLGAVRDADPVRARVGWCALFATIYFAAHQTLDFYANAPSILLAFAIPIAWLDATANPAARAATANATPGDHASVIRLPAGRVIAAIGIVAIVGSVALLGWAEVGAQSMDQGKRNLDAGETSAAIDAIGAAIASDPAIPSYHFSMGLALARDGRLAEAETEFLRSASFDDLPEAWLDLAAVRARLGDGAGSRDALTAAMRMGRQQAAVALGAGATYLELGDQQAAIDAFVQALLLGPSLAGDPWWTADPARAAVWPVVYATAYDRVGARHQVRAVHRNRRHPGGGGSYRRDDGRGDAGDRTSRDEGMDGGRIRVVRPGHDGKIPPA